MTGLRRYEILPENGKNKNAENKKIPGPDLRAWRKTRIKNRERPSNQTQEEEKVGPARWDVPASGRQQTHRGQPTERRLTTPRRGRENARIIKNDTLETINNRKIQGKGGTKAKTNQGDRQIGVNDKKQRAAVTRRSLARRP